MVKRTYPVTGMTCASCVNAVEKVLRAEPGVAEVSVNLATNTALVAWSGSAVSDAGLKAAVQRAGYDLVLSEEEDVHTAVEHARRAQMVSLQRRLLASVVLSVPLMVVGMGFMHAAWSPWVQWALATPVVLVFGRSFFINAWKQARHRTANMDTLVALSTGVSYAFSVSCTLFPQAWRAHGVVPHVYFEASAVVITFILLGKFLEERAKAGANSAIKKLMGMRPSTVLREDQDGLREVPVAEVNVDDVLVVRPGERVAVDGEVVDGESYVDERMISGEPIPVAKLAGSLVLAGTINQRGSLRIRAQRVGAATLLARLVHAVQEAQGSKASVQQLVDRIASVFVPVVMGIAVLSACTWWVFGGEHAFTQGIQAFITVLVIACPCALGLATPTAIMAGLGKGAEHGILIKDADSLERARAITAVVLDKTGTITEGEPQVEETVGLADPHTAALLFTMASRSMHPLAAAVVRHMQPSAGPVLEASHYEDLTGKGVKAVVDGTTLVMGSRRLLEENGIAITEEWRAYEKRWQEAARTVVWLADAERVRAAVAVTDRIKPGAAEVIARLKRMGIQVFMQTGDARRTAQVVAREVGIDDFRSEVLPKDKAAFVVGLQQMGHVVAMVGDGINDSEALAKADVGIAMGKGSDIAMEVARITLLGDGLHAIPRAIALSRHTVAVIRQNLFWAFIYNIVGIPVAAGVLIPLSGFHLDPMLASAAMALSSVSVVSNSARLRWARLDG